MCRQGCPPLLCLFLVWSFWHQNVQKALKFIEGIVFDLNAPFFPLVMDADLCSKAMDKFFLERFYLRVLLPNTALLFPFGSQCFGQILSLPDTQSFMDY